MRVSALFQQMSRDVVAMQGAIDRVFPVHMPSVYETRHMNLKTFLRRLNDVCAPFNVRNVIEEDATMRPGEIILSGLWLSDQTLRDENAEEDVRVIWQMHPSTKRVKWSRYYWNRRRFYFWELLMHELIHRYQPSSNTNTAQYVYRAWAETQEQKKEQEYLGSVDEIETHAHDAALEFITWWPELTLREACSLAKRITGPTPPTYATYVSAFAGCPGHPAVRHFKRKLKAWFELMLEHADFYSSLHLLKMV